MIEEATLQAAVVAEFGTPLVRVPYGRGVTGRTLAALRQADETTPCLVHARMDARWWWDNCLLGEIRFLRGRVRFDGERSGAPFPSAVVVFGPDVVAGRVDYWDLEPRQLRL